MIQFDQSIERGEDMNVLKKQKNSRMCAICGLDNRFGVQAPFYTMEDESVITLFCYRPEHQSYPGIVHGGMVAAMVDELGLRALWAKEGIEHTYGVTTSLDVKYRKPVPYNQPLVGKGQIVLDTGHFFGVRSGIYLKDGTLLAEGEVKYMKVSSEQFGGEKVEHEEMCYLIEDDVKEIIF